MRVFFFDVKRCSRQWQAVPFVFFSRCKALGEDAAAQPSCGFVEFYLDVRAEPKAHMPSGILTKAIAERGVT